LLGSWFGGEIKKRLDRVNEEGKETRVIRFRKRALLEDNVSKMRTAGWEPRWESYRKTQTGLLVRRIIYSVVMERKQRKLERRALKQLSKFLFPGNVTSSKEGVSPSAAGNSSLPAHMFRRNIRVPRTVISGIQSWRTTGSPVRDST